MKQNKTVKNFMRPAALWGVLGIMGAFALFPLFWIVITSFKPNSDILSTDPTFLFSPTLDHWRQVLLEGEFLRYYANSIIIAAGTVIVVMLVCDFGRLRLGSV